MMLLRISCHIGGSEKKETVDFDESTTDFETLLRDIADTLGLECHQSTISNVYELRTLKGGYAVRKTSQLKDEEELVFDQIVVDVEKAAARNEKQRRRQSRREANDATIPVKLEPKDEEEEEEEEERSEISDERERPRRTRGTGTDNSLTLKREENEEEEDGDEEEVTYWWNQPEKQEDDEPEESNIEPTISQVNREEVGQFKEDEEAQRQEAAARPGSQEQTTSPQRTKRQTQPPTVTPERKRAKSRAEDEDDETYRADSDSEKEGHNPQRMVDEVNRDGPLGTGPQHPARQTAARRPNRKKSAETTTTKGDNNNNKKSASAKVAILLPRSRENALKKQRPELTWVIGVDEAGRGPLAGPVVAAAAIVPYNIAGITDSKKVTNEIMREQMYKEIVTSPEVSWAVAVVDAKRIDEINILQATMQAMSMAASALVTLDNDQGATASSDQWDEAIKQPVCVSRKGCYVTCGGTKPRPQQQPMMMSNANDLTPVKQEDGQEKETSSEVVDDPSLSSSYSSSYFALIDGNRTPRYLPCDSEFIVKGNTKEYSIAAASILAKVSRDRLMHQYDKLYPVYKLGKHKGYPTKEHMAAVFEHGASPIHRRTFAPLKHMEFDESGRVISKQLVASLVSS